MKQIFFFIVLVSLMCVTNLKAMPPMSRVSAVVVTNDDAVTTNYLIFTVPGTVSYSASGAESQPKLAKLWSDLQFNIVWSWRAILLDPILIAKICLYIFYALLVRYCAINAYRSYQEDKRQEKLKKLITTAP